MSLPDTSAREKAETPATRLRRAIPLAAVLFCGVAFSSVAALVVRNQERAQFENDFERQAQTHWRAIEVAIQQYEECLYTLRNLFDASGGVNADEFRRAAEDLRARHPGLELLAWLPRVKSGERAAFEAAAVRPDGSRFFIHESASADPALEREEYLPMQFCEPSLGNSRLFGVEHFGGPYQAAIARAVETGAVSATQRVTIVEDHGSVIGWALALAVYAGDAMPRSGVEKRDRLRGVLAGAVPFSRLLDGTMQRMPAGDVDMLLLDASAVAGGKFLAGCIDGRMQMESAGAEEEFRLGPHRELSMRVAGREWVAVFRPSAEHAPMYSWAFLGGGISLTGMLMALLYSAQQRTLTVQRSVRERTAELHAAERTLIEDNQRRRKAEERYRAFVEQSNEAIWRFELTEPIPVDRPVEEQVESYYTRAFLAEANDSFARMYDFERAKEMIGMRLADLMPREPANFEHLRKFVQNDYRLLNAETHEVGRSGASRIFLNNLTGIVEERRLVRAWGTQRDVTEQRRAEEDRRRAEARLRSALAAADLGTWEWDVKADSFAWSETAERMFGLAAGTFRGGLAEYLQMVHPDHRAFIESRLRQIARDGGSLTGEVRIVRGDGAVRWLASRGDVVRDEEGRIIRLVGAVMDVTEQHAAADEKEQIDRRLQETQKLESLGILAGGVAHDFNNLLTGILGNTSLARMDLPVTSPVQAYLEAVEKTSRRAAELCKQMLAYSGKGRFVVQRLDLGEVVADTVQLVHPSISKSAMIDYHFAPDLPAISGDATQMRQIIMNLVINASDALGDGPGVITLRTGAIQADAAYLADTMLSPRTPPGEYVFLEISDTGCGMSSETLSKIFNPFFTTKFTGRGLGLAAVLGIVRGHGGAMKVSSEVGKGSTFRLLLPSAGGPLEKDCADAPTELAWRGSGTVLVADDESEVRKVAARLLELSGYQVVLAVNGREAVDFFREAPGGFVAVLLDLTMPEMDGIAAFTEMRRIRADIPVVLMSGYNEQDAISRFAGQGLAAFMQKPFTPAELRHAFRELTQSPENGVAGA